MLARVALAAFSCVALGCGRSEKASLRSSASQPASAPIVPSVLHTSPSPEELTWEGLLTEHLPSGLVYINDANAKDSRSAFEAVLVPDRDGARTLVGGGPKADGYWTPSTRQALEAGNVILDAIDRQLSGNTPVYRYTLFGTLSGGRRVIRAQAACESPPWWNGEVGRSKLCQSVGSCAQGSGAWHSGRRDCALQWEYDADTRTVRNVQSPTVP